MGVQVRRCGAVSYCDATAEAQRSILTPSAISFPERTEFAEDGRVRAKRPADKG
jgi:hypothetical protein